MAVLFSGVATLTAHATNFTNNSNDVRGAEAHYQVTVNGNELHFNLPGASVTDIGAGVSANGDVTGLATAGIQSTENYDVKLTAGKGDMGKSVTQVSGTPMKGLGLYEGQGMNDLGAVLVNMKLLQSDDTVIPVTLATASNEGCEVNNNIVSFSGSGPSCTLQFTGADIKTIDTQSGAQQGKVNYTVATAVDAGAGHRYSNQINYTIALASI